MKGRSKSSKSLVVYSDLHVGSKLAVCNKDCTIKDYKPNKLQLSLYDIWTETIDSFTQKPHVLVINGEPFDGANPKSLGSQSITTDVGKQIEESAKLIKLIPRVKTVMTKGSGYHVDKEGTSHEDIFARKIGAEEYDAYGTNGGYIDDFAMLRLGGKLFNFTHHIGYSKWQAYRTTALASEGASLHFQYEKLGGKVDVLVRSHVHYFVKIEYVHQIAFTTPAWKYPDRHLYRQGQPPLPDVGCVEVIIESNGEIITKKHITELKIKAKVLEF